MPATEKTWRDQKMLHVVFGCTGLVMLISTIWMFAADHSREWKDYQRKMRSVDVRMTGWRMAEEQTRANAQNRDELLEQLLLEEMLAPSKKTFDQFLSKVKDDAEIKRLNDLYTKLTTAGGDDKPVKDDNKKFHKLYAEINKAGINDETRRDRRVEFLNELRDRDGENTLYGRMNGVGFDCETLRDRRAKLMSGLATAVSQAKFNEDNLLSRRKFKSADYDERRAQYDLAVRDGLKDRMKTLQAEVNKEKAQRDLLTREYQDAAERRNLMQSSLEEMNHQVSLLHDDIEEKQAEFGRLASSLDERQASYFTVQPPFLGKKWLELPILDAFNSPLKIDNLWTKDLTISNGSFGSVTRFDRCTTCHQAMDKTAAGSAVDPLYAHRHEVVFEIILPETAPEATETADGEDVEPTLASVYGIELADEGLVSVSEVTVRSVLPDSLAAFARHISGFVEQADGLRVGDVLAFVNQDKVLSADQARRYLLDNAKWGETAKLTVRRGLPHPYSSHPRLDLFVGSLSPHKLTTFGCSICHEGQGSATEFKWVSHSPNNAEQQRRWTQEYGWFNNHHWIYPMYPKRFAESSCLKCHHEVVELQLADRFEEPPAPKLTHGYDLILTYGCFGCHEINGYKGPDQRIGPDMRLEPNYFAAAAEVKSDPSFKKLDQEEKSWVNQLIYHPERNHVRHELLTFLKEDAFAADPILTKTAHDQIANLEDVETPGDLRKVGPSLRHVKDKLGAEFLYDWIQDPKHFRPSTTMPRFFGQWRHLDEEEKAVSKRYEPIEILGLVKYLLDDSQPQEFISPAKGITKSTVDEQIARGKMLFETRGCLACHQHDDFSYASATHGPNLSNVGDKFSVKGTPDAKRWMYTWLRNPDLYHPRTKMPNLYLEVIEHPDGTKTDPASDIAMFLLNSKDGWKPAADVVGRLQLDDEGLKNLNGLLLEHLQAKMNLKDAEATIKNNTFPEFVKENITGSELLLSGEITLEKKLNYIGARTISKYGCYGCHDIPGFEGAKPIGAALAGWGRKDPSKLAFEHIAEYLHTGHHGEGHGEGHGESADGFVAKKDDSEAKSRTPQEEAEHQRQLAFDAEFYEQSLSDHERAGFIWQKLKEPRSYDYAKARNKDSFNDRLRMPMFPFDFKEREAVITFVLGLVAEPPANEFVYQPDEKRQSIIQGSKVLEKFNCIGCHIIEPEKWKIEFAQGEFGPQGGNPQDAFPFMRPNYNRYQIDDSKETDKYRSLLEAHLVGMPTIDRDGQQIIYDEEGDPVEEGYDYDPNTLLYSFDLWLPTLLDGEPYQVGLNPLEIPASSIVKRSPTYGGDLTKWLLPRIVDIARKNDPQADAKQAYGWLPPPLLGEGNKVQSDWLHEFLLEPSMIRPAAFMRMPKFNMSPEDATELVSYFAARDDAVYPYEYTPWTQTVRLNEEGTEYEAMVKKLPEADRPPGQTRLDQAMNVITSNDYCVKCHLVADYDPGGSLLAKAPDLSVVHRRLRPEYLQHWIAKPVQILPYTPMPVNIQFNSELPHLGGVSQKLFHGTSIEQLNAVVDLLMNYPLYSKERAPIAELVKPAPTGTGEGESGASEAAATGAATTDAAATDVLPSSDAASE
ncbi:MAG: hypothetical protein P8N76_14680 [Pirellulaceae bacterium]|nr:hypothetical protein [Pirellulaceae bacterium]